jgi:replicative DNA helicase
MLELVPNEPSLGSRQPPSNRHAEQAALGAVLIKPTVLDELLALAVDDFLFPDHREILEAMRALDGRGLKVDPIVLADELKTRGVLGKLEGGEAYLLTLANATPTAENVEYYVRIVAAKATLRRLIATCAEISSSAYGDLGDVEEFLREARAKVTEIDVPGGAGPQPIGPDLDPLLEELERRAQQPEAFALQTGLRAFDEKTGGLHAPSMIVVAANPGMGKTSWAWNVAIHNARRALPVLVFSLEMKRKQLVERAIVLEARVNSHSVRLGRLSTQDWVRIHGASARLVGANLMVDDRNLTSKGICATARRWWQRWKYQKNPRDASTPMLGLVVIDYLGLVESDDPDERTRERQVARMSRRFKLLAMELGIPVVLISQLSRDNTKAKEGSKPRRPVLSDLRDSGAVEADADMVVFTWREGDPERVNGVLRQHAELLVPKNRIGGVTGDVDCEWFPEFMAYEDAQVDAEQAEMQFP